MTDYTEPPTPTRIKMILVVIAAIIIFFAALAWFFKWQLDEVNKEQSGRSEYVACVSQLPLESIRALDQIVLDGVVRRDLNNLTVHEQALKDALDNLEDIDAVCPPPD